MELFFKDYQKIVFDLQKPSMISLKLHSFQYTYAALSI